MGVRAVGAPPEERFPPRGSDDDINSWAALHVMTRGSIWSLLPSFLPTHAATWDFAIRCLYKPPYPLRDQNMFAGRNAETFTLRDARCHRAFLIRGSILPAIKLLLFLGIMGRLEIPAAVLISLEVPPSRAVISDNSN